MPIALPRDGDGDGRIYDGTVAEQDAPDDALVPLRTLATHRPPQAPLPVPPRPPRDLGDIEQTRAAVFEKALEAARRIEPLVNDKYSLSLADVAYEGADTFTPADATRAKLEGKTLSRRLRGTWVLKDALGQEVSQRRATVAEIPYLSDDGTYVLDGTGYTLASQLRLAPGIYTIVRGNGEVASHVNVPPGKGMSHWVTLDRASGVFNAEYGQAAVPLLPILLATGVDPDAIKAAWGPGVYSANVAKSSAGAVDKAWSKLARRGTATDPRGRAQELLAAMKAMPLDPDVSRRNLGRPYDAATPDALLAATGKLLALSRGEADPDDRDHAANMLAMGPEDLFAERIARDHSWLRRQFWKASFAGNLDKFPAGVLSRSARAAIQASGLGQPSESINPLMISDQLGRISRLGVGGIPSTDSIPASSRDVQPSQYGYVDYIVTPESLAAGVDTRVARGARKRGNELVAPYYDPRTGQTTYKSAREVVGKVLGIPDPLYANRPYVPAIVDGKIDQVDPRRIDFYLPATEDTLSPAMNLIPMKSNNKAQRNSMGARMMTQALPLVGGEAPWVQSATPEDPSKSFDEIYGDKFGAKFAKAAGTVVAVKDDLVTLRGDDGTARDYHLHVHDPLNRKTGLHNTPMVSVGQRVEAGGLLAKSNFTDDKGRQALGLNLRTAYIADKGHNFEDAFSISESAAKKFTSDTYYQHQIEPTSEMTLGKANFISIFATKYPKTALDSLDDAGVARPGTVVHYGDPLILATKQRSATYGQLHRGRTAFSDASEVWKHHEPGIVRHATKMPKSTSVVVHSQAALERADKLSGRVGDKGVVARIIPDDQMPHDAAGVPFEILINSAGLISRTNASQAHEAILGKIAAKTGVPYKIQDFHTEQDRNAFVAREAARHGVAGRDTVIDPATGREIRDEDGKQPLTGVRWIMKLHHTAASKGQGRSTGGYTQDGSPAKGGEHGSKRVSLLDLSALLAHGAHGVIRDAGTNRGQAQPDYWAAYMSGQSPTSRTPVLRAKFLDQLRGSGINVLRQGSALKVQAMAPADVDKLAAGRELQNTETVDWKTGNLKPVKGGLFDESLTGGPAGNLWSKITLAEPFPNPIMEEPARRVLGLTKAAFRNVIGGTEKLGDKTGPGAIAHALDKIDLPQAIKHARDEMASTRGARRDDVVRRLRYLASAEKLGLHPRDWVLHAVPVLPPTFRPVSAMQGSGLPMIADANLLYGDLFDANKNLKDLTGRATDLSDERLAVYDSWKAVTGLGDPISQESKDRDVKGLLAHIAGNNPKTGIVQRKLLGTTADLVGRAVIIPNPDLDMDQVGLPENHAWEIYKPHVIRRLVRRGMDRVAAARAVADRTPAARDELLKDFDERPVFVARAPVLHRYGVMAFNPVLVKGDAMHISPMVVTGFGADFDGDTMQFHAPNDADATRDMVEKMLPSRNLFSAASFKADSYLPGKEYVGGLYSASTAKSQKRHQYFATEADALAAHARGDLDLGDRIMIHS